MGNFSPSEEQKLLKALPGGVKLGTELMDALPVKRWLKDCLPELSLEHAPSADKPGDKVSCVITLFFRFNTIIFRLEIVSLYFRLKFG